jgi:hypothetical protein
MENVMLKKSLFVIVVFVMTSFIARSQELHRIDVSAGYSFNKPTSGCCLLNGFDSSVSVNMNRWFGVIGDFGYFHSGQITYASGGYKPADNLFTFLVGPRITYRNSSRVEPFVELFYGGAHETLVEDSPFPSQTSSGIVYGYGAGVDIPLNKKSKFAIRPEYKLLDVPAVNQFAGMSIFSIDFVYKIGGRHVGQ